MTERAVEAMAREVDAFYRDMLAMPTDVESDIRAVAAIIAKHLRPPAQPASEREAEIRAVLVGGNHLANVLIQREGADFATRYPFDMEPDEALHRLCATQSYDVWCAWSAIMKLSRALAKEPQHEG